MQMKNYFNLKKSKLLLLTLLTMLVVGARPAWAQKALPYSYGFEEASCSTSGWTKVNCQNSSENYKLGTSDAYEGEYAFRFYYTSNYPQYLISPELATSSYSISVSFWYKAHSTSYEESFKVGYSTTDAETSSFTFGDEVKTKSTNWQEYTTTCPAGTKYICIACTSNNKYFLYIDDLVVDSDSPYKTPKAFATTGVTGTTATFGWTAGGDETAWQIAYSTTKGFDADAATKVDVTTNPYTLEGLTAETTYYARIRADYGSGNYSAWSDEVSFKPTNAITTTVNDGSSTNSHVPFNGNYADTNGTMSQFIIPASTLTSLQGRMIQDMTFYTSTATKDFGNARFDVYMAETSTTAFDAATFDWSDMDQVAASATVNIADGKMTITLDEGFDYSGDNLKIGFKLVVTGGYTATSWYGIAVENAAIKYYSSSGGGATIESFLPKITFTSLPSPAVKRPRNLAVTPSSTTAEVTWTGDAETFDIDVNGTVTEGVASPYTLENLTPVTTYSVKVRGRSGDDVSDWSSTVSFTTLEKYPIPTDVVAALTMGDGTVATLSWTENGTATQWQICLNDDEENLITTDENPFNLTGLTPETTYTAKVRAVVGDEWGNWSDAVSFTPSNAYSVTINEGTTTNEYVPIYGYYVDAMTKSQFVIPASSLQDMQWGNITKMTFYTQESSINWGNAQFEVYMTEQDGATLSSMTDYGAMTKVKSAGSLSVSDGKMVVTLDEPYLYRGDDLVIGFLQTVRGTYVRSHWYGVTADGASFGGYGSSVSQKSFLPKTTFVFEPGEHLTLAENADNSTVISENNGKLTNVTLTRTLQTGGWNTFCAPFSTETPSGWTVKELSSSAFNSSTGELTLNFGAAESIEAGKPYLVKVDANVVNPTFNGVTISSTTTTTETTAVDFVPVMNPTNLTGGDKTVLFIIGGNTLTYPSGDGNINGFRAYFKLKDEVAAQASAFHMSFDDDVTGITTVISDEPTTASGTYTLDGRRIEGEPTQKGMYIVNGKKVIK